MGHKQSDHSTNSPNPISEQIIRKFFVTAADCMFVVDNTGAFVAANDAACTLSGYARDGLLSLTLPDLFVMGTAPPRPLRYADLPLKKALLQGLNGRTRPVTIETSPLGADCLLLTIRLAGDRTFASSPKNYLRRVLNAIPDFIWLKDPDGVYLAANPMFERFAGVTEAELLGKTDADLFSPERAEHFRERDRQAISTGKPIVYEEWVSSGKDAPPVLLETVKTPLFDEDGQLLGVLGIARDITERQQAVEAVRKLAKFPNENPNPIMRVAQDGTLLYANQASTALLESWHCAVGQALPDAWPGHIQDVLSSGRAKEVETAVAGRTFSLSLVPLVDDDYVNIYGYDITRRKQAQKEVQESQRRLAEILDSAMDAIVTVDETQHIVLFNAAAEEMFGYTAAEVIGQSHDILLPEQFRRIHQAYIEQFAQTGETRRKIDPKSTLRAIRASGEEFPVDISISEAVADGQRLYTAILRDVTARQMAEVALREQEEHLRLFIEHAPASLAMFDREMRYLFVSRRWLVDYNLGDQDVIGRSHYDVFPEIPDRWKAIHQRGLAGAVIRAEEDEFIRADGTVQWLRWEVRPWYTTNDAVGGIVVFSEDITERRQIKAKLEELQDILAEAESVAKIGSWKWDLATQKVTWSDEMYYLFGVDRENFEGDVAQVINDRIHPDDIAAVNQSNLSVLEDLKPVPLEYRIVLPDGTERVVWAEGRLVHDKNAGEPVALVGYVQDITERKQVEAAQVRLEEQLRQSQKMESIGRLAGGVAHDFNNQLTIIQLYSDLIRRNLAQNDLLRPKLEQIHQAAGHAANLTQQLLAFSRKQVLQPVTLNLNDLVNNLQMMLSRLIGEDIIFSTNLEPGLWSVQADPGQIEQVIMNLVVNARDAMPTGGILTIETDNVVLDEQVVTTHLDAPLGPCVMLVVSDTGHGMDEATQNQIFEPFFTTKGVGEGTGLGLATVHGIVNQSGGAIYVYSEPGQGTTFKIYLPASGGVTESAVDSSVKELPHGHETILLVEDEADLRDLVKVTLQEMGYTVLVAGNGRAALELAAEQTTPIDLLLTDVVMPQMSGRELSQALLGRWPTLRVLFMSGYMDDEVVRHGLLMAQVNFLSKPFTRSVLASKVREVLDK